MHKGCPKCGRMIAEEHKKCPYCGYEFKKIEGFFNKVKNERFVENEKYAGFIKRLISGLFDIIIITMLAFTINYFSFKNNIYTLVAIFLILYVLINTLLERTPLHGSLGKALIGIEVTDEYENPITIQRAFIRNILKILNVITLGTGFIICAAPPTKQTLGDYASKTYVLSKINIKTEKTLNYVSLSRRMFAFIIDLIFIAAIDFLIVYAVNYISTMGFVTNTIENILNYVRIILPITFSVLYFPINESRRGQTVGKKFVHIRLINEEDKIINFYLAFAREILIILDILTLGFLLVFTNKQGQTLKDKITKTVVIEE